MFLFVKKSVAGILLLANLVINQSIGEAALALYFSQAYDPGNWFNNIFFGNVPGAEQFILYFNKE